MNLIQFLLIFFLLPYTFTFSQEDDESLEISIKDILQDTVSLGTFKPEKEMSSSANVTKITPKQWEQKGAKSTTDAIETIPGISLATLDNGLMSFFIRGYAQASNNAVATLVDGVNVDDATHGGSRRFLPSFELGLLKEMEVLKGPGSALYGPGALHGAVGYQTFESDKNELNATIKYGSFNYHQAVVKFSHGIYHNLFRLDLSAGLSGQTNQDITIDRRIEYPEHSTPTANSFPVAFHKFKAKTIKNDLANRTAIFKVKMKELFKLGYYLNTSNAAERQRGGKVSSTTSGEGGIGGQRSQFQMFRASGKYDLIEHWHAEWIASHQYSTSIQSIENTDSFRLVSPSVYSNKERRKSIEAFLKGNLYFSEDIDTDLTLAAGKKSFKVTQANWGQAQYYFPTLTGTPTTALQTITGEDFSPYAHKTRSISHVLFHLTTHFWDRFHFTFGGRHDHIRDLDKNTFSPKASLVANPTPSSAVKLLYSKGVNAPSLIAIHGLNFSQYQEAHTLEPETLDSIEVQLIKHDVNYRLQLGVFFNKWKKTLVSKDLTNTVSSFENKGKNKSKGIEARADWVEEYFEVQNSMSYVTSAKTTFEDANGVIRDSKFRAAPKWIYHWTGTFKWPKYRFKTHLHGHHLINQYANGLEDSGFNDTKLPTYFRLDWVTQYEYSKNFQFELAFINLTDRKNRGPSLGGDSTGVVLPGMSVTAGVQYIF